MKIKLDKPIQTNIFGDKVLTGRFQGYCIALCEAGLVTFFPHLKDRADIEIHFAKRNPKKAGFKKIHIHCAGNRITFDGNNVPMVIGYSTYNNIKAMGFVGVDFWIRAV